MIRKQIAYFLLDWVKRQERGDIASTRCIPCNHLLLVDVENEVYCRYCHAKGKAYHGKIIWEYIGDKID
jgi:hypothetical protein